MLTLSVMSAFVAFNGFPGEDVQAPIHTLLVQQRQTSVPVHAKPVRVDVRAATRHPAITSGSSHHAAARHAGGPTASTDPVVQHTAPQATPPPAQSPAPPSGSGGGSATTPVAQSTPLADPDTAPTVPSTTTTPKLPITLPSLTPSSPPPQQSGSSVLPVDTSGITDLLGSL